MKIACLTFLFMVSVTAPAWARLGESGDAVIARYGQPLSEFDQKAEGGKIPLVKLTFQKNGYEIEVSLSDGISAAESFKKMNGDPLTTGDALTLLTANAQGLQWEAPQLLENGVKRWTRDDGARATLSDDRIFYITTRQLMDAEKTAAEVTDKPTLDGF